MLSNGQILSYTFKSSLPFQKTVECLSKFLLREMLNLVEPNDDELFYVLTLKLYIKAVGKHNIKGKVSGEKPIEM